MPKLKSSNNEVPETETDPLPMYELRQLYNVNIQDLVTDPNQPRKSLDPVELNELETSILKHGVLQPIHFRRDEAGKLIIVAGERRYRASILAQLDTIPAIFTDGNPAEIALVENMVRVGLTALEEAEGLKRLQETGYNNKQLAAVIGKAESTISEILSLNKLTQKIKDKIKADKTYSRRQLVEIAKYEDEKSMNKAFTALEKNNSSSDELRNNKRGARKIESVIKTMVNSLTRTLDGLDYNSLEKVERESISEELRKLLVKIGEKLS